ncbi:MAG TPA: hypothetical protein VNU25_00045 [Candidatus Paceibacterota bacterium]|nr:hypothetical protein [Candidatus Paceibacterota bacterium]
MSSGGGHSKGGLPFMHHIEHWMHDAHERGGTAVEFKPLVIAFAAEIVAFFFVAPAQTLTNFQFLLFLSPLWIPLLLYHFTFMRYVQANKVAWIAKQKHVLVEIRMPRDTRRTPLAMETVFSSMHIGGGENTWYKRIFQGRARPWYSYEIASIGGRIHYFAWMREQWRRPFESYMYAQYPGVEIIEAMDYSRLVDPSHHPYTMTAFEYSKIQPDPYPIKTYPEYGLDQVQKPEEQVDPLAQLLEVMGSLGPQEQLWLQFVVRVHQGKPWDSQPTPWKEMAKEVIAALREEDAVENEYVDASGKTRKTVSYPNPTRAMATRIEAIERNTGKQAYDVGIRGIYCAPEAAAHSAMGGILANLFRAFGSEQHNTLMPVDGRWSNHYNDYPWEDPHGHHTAHMNHDVLEFYRRRCFFHPPYVGKYNVMSVEELATLYHVPSSSVTTPSLPRIQSTTSEAPSNLPT